MRIASGVTDQYLYFVAVDATDFTTRETGLSSFTVYRSRNGGTATAMTTPTVAELSAGNMPGVYSLLLDEDTTIDAGDAEQEMVYHITHAGMAPVTRSITIFAPDMPIGNGMTLSGRVAQGTLNGTHSSTTADLGTNAPVNDIAGMTLYFPDDQLSRHVDSYNTGTGVATFSPSVPVTLTNGDNWVLFPSPPASTGAPPAVDLTMIAGSAVDTTSAQIGVNVVNWKTTTAPAMTGDAYARLGAPAGASVSADILVASNAAQAAEGYITWLASGTATIGSTGNDTTHIHVPSWTYGDDEINDWLIAIYDVSEDETHYRWIEDWVNSTKLVTVATLPFTPQNATDSVSLIAARQDVTGGSGLDAAGVRAAIGMASANLDTQLGSIQTDTTNIEADTQDIQSRLPAALVGGRIDATVDATGMEAGAVATILTTQMTESYAADGAAPTIAQALMMIQQMLGEFAVSGTTLTVKKVDGSTSAATYTLSDATDPTSITRAS